jgi:hypothetical protein
MSNPVTFTATVSSSAGTPTGTVSFYDGATLLGSGVVNSGVGTFTTSVLAAGSHSITAVYSGDSNFGAATSNGISETIQDFAVAVTKGGGSSITESEGGQAVFPLTVSPLDGATFPGTVTLSVSGLPSGATAAFEPASVLSGWAATFVTMTVNLPDNSAAQHAVSPFGRGVLPVVLGLILLPFAGKLRKASRRLNRIVSLIVIGLAAVSLVAGLTGCGSVSSSPAQSYTLTVTGTAGSLTHSTTVSLTVK